MGRSKPVKIGQKEFKSKTAAVDYFMDQREAVKAVGPLKEGELFDELRDRYRWDGIIFGVASCLARLYRAAVNYVGRATGQSIADSKKDNNNE